MARDPTRDIIRGLTSLEMTFVNISSLRWTSHSPYIGQLTYADTIFPCFAFLSGMSPTLPRRNIGLIGLGLGLNTLSAAINNKPAIRIPGVLQRLGLSSLIANNPFPPILRQYHGAPLIFLWYIIIIFGAPKTIANNPLAHPKYPCTEPWATAQNRLDKLLFGPPRLYTPIYDPEGLLGSLTTATSMLIGRSFTSSQKNQNLSAAQKALVATTMITLGETLHYLLPKYAPISKSLWTPSFVLVTSGISILKYLAVEKIIPYLPLAFGNLLSDVGKRSLEVYVSSAVLTALFKIGGEQSFMAWCMRFMGHPAVADFVVSLGLTGIVAAVAKVLVLRDLRLCW